MFFIFMTPFYCAFPFLMILPLIKGNPEMLILIPFGLTTLSLLLGFIQGQLWRNSILSLTQFKEHINQIRRANAVSPVGE
jgi:hypothetical protein